MTSYLAIKGRPRPALVAWSPLDGAGTPFGSSFGMVKRIRR